MISIESDTQRDQTDCLLIQISRPRQSPQPSAFYEVLSGEGQAVIADQLYGFAVESSNSGAL